MAPAFTGVAAGQREAEGEKGTADEGSSVAGVAGWSTGIGGGRAFALIGARALLQQKGTEEGWGPAEAVKYAGASATRYMGGRGGGRGRDSAIEKAGGAS